MQRYDGFVIDWIVGETSTLKLIASLREQDASAPIVVLTGKVLMGMVDEADIAEAVKTYGLVFSEKPVRMSILSATLALAFAAAQHTRPREDENADDRIRWSGPVVGRTTLNKPGKPRHGPDRAAALAQYRRRAGVYDMELALFEPVRRKAIERLALRPGDVVLDVGCGTGLSFELVRKAVGAKGRIIGIEQSPEMIEKAQERVSQHGWSNVRLLCSPVETAGIPGRADAALFHFTHDILRRPEAVANVVHHLKPGARVVASGLKWATGLAATANPLVLAAALRSVTSLEGLRKPWSRLAAHTRPLDVETMLLGGVYIASGELAEGK
ncbi:MAG: methyltransferase domain-containing protein [Caldimonas sp.]